MFEPRIKKKRLQRVILAVMFFLTLEETRLPGPDKASTTHACLSCSHDFSKAFSANHQGKCHIDLALKATSQQAFIYSFFRHMKTSPHFFNNALNQGCCKCLSRLNGSWTFKRHSLLWHLNVKARETRYKSQLVLPSHLIGCECGNRYYNQSPRAIT